MNLSKAVKRINWYTEKVSNCRDSKRWIGRWEQQNRRAQRLIRYKYKLNELLLKR